MQLFEIWPSKVNLSSISMLNTSIVSEDGREIFSTVTFNWISKKMVWKLSGFATKEFYLNHSIKEHFLYATYLWWYQKNDLQMISSCHLYRKDVNVTVEQNMSLIKMLTNRDPLLIHEIHLFLSVTNHFFCHVFWPCGGGYGDSSRLICMTRY